MVKIKAVLAATTSPLGPLGLLELEREPLGAIGECSFRVISRLQVAGGYRPAVGGERGDRARVRGPASTAPRRAGATRRLCRGHRCAHRPAPTRTRHGPDAGAGARGARRVRAGRPGCHRPGCRTSTRRVAGSRGRGRPTGLLPAEEHDGSVNERASHALGGPGHHRSGVASCAPKTCAAETLGLDACRASTAADDARLSTCRRS